MATFLTAADIPNKSSFKFEEMKKFSDLVFPLIMWETASRIQSLLKLVDFNTQEDILEIPNQIKDNAQFLKDLPARLQAARDEVANRQGSDVEVKLVDKDKEAVNKAIIDFTDKSKTYTETPKSSNNFLSRLYQMVLRDPCGKRAKKKLDEKPSSNVGLTKRDSISATSRQLSDKTDILKVLPKVDNTNSITLSHRRRKKDRIVTQVRSRI